MVSPAGGSSWSVGVTCGVQAASRVRLRRCTTLRALDTRLLLGKPSKMRNPNPGGGPGGVRAVARFWGCVVVRGRFFSASVVLGSRAGSVGVAVAGCAGCAWVWRRGAGPSLVLSVPLAWPSWAGSAVAASVLGRVCVAAGVPGVSVSVRVVRGRRFVRVRGPLVSLRVVAAWWAALVACPPVGQGS